MKSSKTQEKCIQLNTQMGEIEKLKVGVQKEYNNPKYDLVFKKLEELNLTSREGE